MDSDNIDAVLDRANRLLEAGRPAESLRCLDAVEGQLLDADERIECGALRAAALSEMNQPDEALGALEPLLEEFPQSARLLGALGAVLSAHDELERAREVLEAARRLDPEDGALLANLALVHEKLQDYSTAVQLYDQAVAQGADLDWVLRRKAEAQVEAGETDAAKGTLRRYLSLAPDDAAQWISLAILHSDDGEYEEAFGCYARAEEADPDSAPLRLNWGVTAVRAGQLRVAHAQLRELGRIDPSPTRPLLLRAFILEEEGDPRGALRCYSQALAPLGPDSFPDLCYALEMAMDFCTRRKMRARCERLLRRAYQANACTVELCEAYRELTGRRLLHGYWFDLVLEADYRPGLCEVRERGATPGRPPARFQRHFQVVAGDRDEAVTLACKFAERMGETGLQVCEFVHEERLDNVYAGIYEVDRESVVLGPS